MNIEEIKGLTIIILVLHNDVNRYILFLPYLYVQISNPIKQRARKTPI